MARKFIQNGGGLFSNEAFSITDGSGYIVRNTTLGCQPLYTNGGIFVDVFNYTALAFGGLVGTMFGPYYLFRNGFFNDGVWTATDNGLVVIQGSGSTVWLGCSALPNTFANQGAYVVCTYSTGPFFNAGEEISPIIMYDPNNISNHYRAAVTYNENSDHTNRHFTCHLIKSVAGFGEFVEASGTISNLVQTPDPIGHPTLFAAQNFPIGIYIKSEYQNGIMTIRAFFDTGGGPLNIKDSGVGLDGSIQTYSFTGGPNSPSGSAGVHSPDSHTGTGTGATFKITWAASAYNLEIVNRGTGYNIGDTLTFLGSSLGESSPANDIVVTVVPKFDGSPGGHNELAFVDGSPFLIGVPAWTGAGGSQGIRGNYFLTKFSNTPFNP